MHSRQAGPRSVISALPHPLFPLPRLTMSGLSTRFIAVDPIANPTTIPKKIPVLVGRTFLVMVGLAPAAAPPIID